MTRTATATGVRPPHREAAFRGDRSDARPRARRFTLGALLRDVGITILGVLGVLCILWVGLSAIFNLSLITFATGSMAPTIPTGSLAVVREVPASELRPGDVATLQRGGEPLPITHRVLTVTPSPTDATTQIVTMQGDANPIPDVFPYYVDTAKVVLWSVPNGVVVTRALSNPLVIGGVTLGVGALVLWAFWPRKTEAGAAAASTSPDSLTELPHPHALER